MWSSLRVQWIPTQFDPVDIRQESESVNISTHLKTQRTCSEETHTVEQFNNIISIAKLVTHSCMAMLHKELDLICTERSLSEFFEQEFFYWINQLHCPGKNIIMFSEMLRWTWDHMITLHQKRVNAYLNEHCYTIFIYLINSEQVINSELIYDIKVAPATAPLVCSSYITYANTVCDNRNWTYIVIVLFVLIYIYVYI